MAWITYIYKYNSNYRRISLERTLKVSQNQRNQMQLYTRNDQLRENFMHLWNAVEIVKRPPYKEGVCLWKLEILLYSYSYSYWNFYFCGDLVYRNQWFVASKHIWVVVLATITIKGYIKQIWETQKIWLLNPIELK